MLYFSDDLINISRVLKGLSISHNVTFFKMPNAYLKFIKLIYNGARHSMDCSSILFFRCTPVLKSPFLSYMQPVPSLVCPLSHLLFCSLLLCKKNFKKERIVVIFFCNCHIRLYLFLLVFWR